MKNSCNPDFILYFPGLLVDSRGTVKHSTKNMRKYLLSLSPDKLGRLERTFYVRGVDSLVVYFRSYRLAWTDLVARFPWLLS